MEKLGESNVEDRNCRKKLLQENLSIKKQDKKDEERSKEEQLKEIRGRIVEKKQR